jgi:hypothetical protein
MRVGFDLDENQVEELEWIINNELMGNKEREGLKLCEEFMGREGKISFIAKSFIVQLIESYIKDKYERKYGGGK